MSDRERYVLEILRQRFGVVLRPVPRQTTKTPDFELVESGKQILVAEMKTITIAPRTAEAGWTVRHVGNGITESTRDDNGPSRVGHVIYKAWKQLRGYDCAKVVILLNEEGLVDVHDLVEACTGQHIYSNGHFTYVNASSMRIANGDLAKALSELDLFIFIDKVRESKVFVRITTTPGYDIAHRYLNDGANQIPPPTPRAS